MSKIKIGHGVFGWDGIERRSNRYGSIHLVDNPYGEACVAKVTHDSEALSALSGKRVRLTCKVLESRESGHLGDAFLGIRPSQPDVGEEIDLGVGDLTTAIGYDSGLEILLQPEDGRQEFWMDPRKFYRLHDQTVDLFAEETSDEYSPKPKLKTDSGGAVDNGDGSLQVKTKNESALNSGSLKVLPKIERIDDGLFLFTPVGAGKPGDRYEIKEGPKS